MLTENENGIRICNDITVLFNHRESLNYHFIPCFLALDDGGGWVVMQLYVSACVSLCISK